LSRDPEDGYIDLPATLHKYLYVGGDPVNLKDPTGHMFDTGQLLFRILTVVVVVELVEAEIHEVMDCVAEYARSVAKYVSTPHVTATGTEGCQLTYHDDWPDNMPPAQPPPRWGQPWERAPEVY
jgi:hypothetical protein